MYMYDVIFLSLHAIPDLDYINSRNNYVNILFINMNMQHDYADIQQTDFAWAIFMQINFLSAIN